jgi:hypothetical protein
MGDTAYVTSIDALGEFRAAWVELREKIIQAITVTDGELVAAFRFIEQQQQHWKRETTRTHEAYVETKAVLKRKELGRTFGHKVDTTVAEEDVRKAKARWQYAETKLQNVRRWAPKLEHAEREYVGPKQSLSVQAETEMIKALAYLDQKIDALQRYLATSAPTFSRSPGGTGVGGGGVPST